MFIGFWDSHLAYLLHNLRVSAIEMALGEHDLMMLNIQKVMGIIIDRDSLAHNHRATT